MVIAVEGSLLQHSLSNSVTEIRRLGSAKSARKDGTSTVSIPSSSSFGLARASCCIEARLGAQVNSRLSSSSSPPQQQQQHGGSLTPYELRAIPVLASSVVGVTAARPVNAAAIAETDGLKWWEKGSPPNMLDVHSTQEFVDALSGAGDKLVVVEFFATWCGSCRALYPKFCKLAAEYDGAHFIKVNFDENKPMCKSLNIKVLPFFHFYRGAEGKLDGFSCSLSKLQKLKDAIKKHYEDDSSTAQGLSGDLQVTDVTSLLESKPVDQPAAASGTTD